MPIAIVGVKLLLIVSHGVRLMLELIAIPGMKCNAYRYTCSEALCSLLYME